MQFSHQFQKTQRFVYFSLKNSYHKNYKLKIYVL
jgi:hypothetical protein